MGQVYRATDTTLGRRVAIKILPDAFAADPERLARFEREAKTLASLNHPHIAAIYGFEKSGGLHALIEHPDQLRRLRDDPSLMPLAAASAINNSAASWIKNRHDSYLRSDCRALQGAG